MKNSSIFMGCIVLFALLLSSCSSISHYQQPDAALLQDNPKSAFNLLSASKKTSYSEKDKILYYLDAGLMSYYAKNYEESIKFLTDAEQAIEEAYTKSVTKTAGTFLVNDNTQSYSGEDYEDVYLNIIKSLEYSDMMHYDDAMVEVRRVGNKIKFLASKYDADTATAQDSIHQQSNKISYTIDTSPVRFTDSTLARYLSMIFYRYEGHSDEAEIDRNNILVDFRNQPTMYNFPVPRCLLDELSTSKDTARLNIISFSGYSPVKIQETTRISVGNDKYVKIALPVMVARPSIISKVELVLDSGKVYPLDEIENISAVAFDTFRIKANLIYLKSILRSLVKTATAVAFDQGSKNVNNSDTAAVLSLIGSMTQLYAEVSEQADLRAAHYIPGRVDVAGVSLEPGIYSFTLRYLDAKGKAVMKRRFDMVEVAGGKINLLDSVCIK